jgi:hypothetical protein
MNSIMRSNSRARHAHARTGLEAHEAVGLGRGGVDDLPDVDAHAIREHRDLVDHRDVDRAEDVLQQLGELGRLGARDADDLVADLAVERLGAIAACLGEPRHHLRRVAQREVRAPGVDALGRVGEVEVAAGDEPGLLEDRRHALARGAGVGRRLQDDQLVALHDVCEDAGRVDERAKVGLAVRRQRRRHADENGIATRQVRRARRDLQARGDVAQPAGVDVLDVGHAAIEPLDLAGVDVDADDVVALLGEGHGKRQPDIAEPHDAHPHGAAVYDGGWSAFRLAALSDFRRDT